MVINKVWKPGEIAGIRYLFLLALYVLLCMLFQGSALFFGYKRHFFSAEMLLAFLFFSMGCRLLGGMVFAGAIVIELVLGILSIFSLYEVAQVWDMTEFLFEARPSYILSLALLWGLVIAVIWIAIRIQRGLMRSRHALLQILVALGLFQCQWVISSEQETFFTPNLADRKHLLFGSEAHFVHEIMVANRGQVIGNGPDEDADYVPINHPSAANLVWNGQRLPSRVLFIIAEAWGLSKEPVVIERQIESLRSNPHVRGLELRKIHAIGATATGELRELCGVIPTRLNFRKLTAAAVGDCLPAQLRRQGYATVGIHGAYGGMYRRTLWWPEIGLGERMFKETIPLSEAPCFSFPGHCDRYLFNTVQKKLTGEKVFVYWLTLNSHMPYDRRDVTNYRNQLCDMWAVGSYSEQLCDYQNLHTQFFDGLSALIADEKMKGVDVVVVGDHPPLFNDADSRGQFSRDQVPVLHFTVQ